MPGTRHAKNNTALGFFTRAEREKLDSWGAKQVRLSKESVKKYDACSICFKTCELPMVCPYGDLFCKQCVYQSLLLQKKKIKQQMRKFEEQQLEFKTAEQEKIQDKLVKKFVGVESSVVATPNHLAETYKNKNKNNSSSNNNSNSNSNNNNNNNNNSGLMATLSKSSSSSSSEVGGTNSGQNKEKDKLELGLALKTSKEETTDTDPDVSTTNSNSYQRDKTLNCFWIPDLTPNAGKPKINAPDLKTYCQGCNNPLRVTQLSQCIFSTAPKDEKDTNNNPKFICPSCRKELNDVIKMACLKRCGHILCLSCVKDFVATTKSCCICDEVCRKKDVIVLKSGGTGFASHDHQLEATRKDVAFHG